MNEPTLTPAPQEAVPVSVPAASPELTPRGTSADQLPTARVPAISLPLPPPVPPKGPALKTQPLRAWSTSSTDHSTAAPASRARVSVRAGRAFEASLGAVDRSIAWVKQATTARNVGVACVVGGGAMVVSFLLFGWLAVASDSLDRGRGDAASLAAALILARAALAIAGAFVGFGVLRVGERTLRSTHDAGTMNG